MRIGLSFADTMTFSTTEGVGGIESVWTNEHVACLNGPATALADFGARVVAPTADI